MELLIQKGNQVSRYPPEEMNAGQKASTSVLGRGRKREVQEFISYMTGDDPKSLMKSRKKKDMFTTERYVNNISFSGDHPEEKEASLAISEGLSTPKRSKSVKSEGTRGIKDLSGKPKHHSSKKTAVNVENDASVYNYNDDDGFTLSSLLRKSKPLKYKTHQAKARRASNDKLISKKIKADSIKKKMSNKKQCATTNTWEENPEDEEIKDTKQNDGNSTPPVRRMRCRRPVLKDDFFHPDHIYWGDEEEYKSNNEDIVEEEDDDVDFCDEDDNDGDRGNEDNFEILTPTEHHRQLKNVQTKETPKNMKSENDIDFIEEKKLVKSTPSRSSSSSDTITKRRTKDTGDSSPGSSGNIRKNGKEYLKCHQCKRNERKIVVPCTKCSETLYCIQCIKQWYPDLSEEEVAKLCPLCRGNCNCNLCLHSNIKISSIDLTHDEKFEHLHYLINSLLPFLKQIRQEQVDEIAMEAFVRGIPESSIIIEQTNCLNEERVYW